ncbi:uncharacterized protein LOC135218736 [Macrobrachium nipponense]|uniref:uncharacterized protein LOC135218736 n=1 Tax=Macrobrachium nipponense TaxID=159736 RepID=UPI0030C8A6DD
MPSPDALIDQRRSLNMKLVLALTILVLDNCRYSLQQGNGDQNGDKRVNILSFHRGIWIVPSDRVFARFNFSDYNGSVSALSVCYRIRLEKFVDLNVHLSYSVSQDNFDILGFSNAENQFMTWFYGQPLTDGLPPNWAVAPETWNHLCHIFEQESYRIYWNGKLYYSTSLDFSWSFPFNGSLVLGQEQDVLGGGFDSTQILMGDLAQVSFWDRALPESEVESLASCRSPGRGNSFSSDTAQMELTGVVETSTNLSQLCRSTSHFYLMLPEMRSFKDTISICRVLNSTVVAPRSAMENERLTQEMVPFHDVCFPSTTWKIWLGFTDELEEDVWRDVATQQPTSYKNFGPNFPHGGRIYNCVCLMTDGHWIDTECKNTNRRCTACQLDRSDFLRLRGLCYDSEHETRFRASGYIHGRPFFYGYYNMLIVWDPDRNAWELKNVSKNKTILSISTTALNSYPFGKHAWTVNTEVCGQAPGKSMILSLSPCNRKQFMCRSGDCILHTSRCNLRYDCEDGTDEVDCNRIIVSDEYQNQLPPVGPGGKALQLRLELLITRIASIDELSMAITLEFGLTLSWIDERITIKHLKSSSGGTILTTEDKNKVWKPTYKFVNLQGGKVQLLEENMKVLTANDPELPNFNNQDMDIAFPGENNSLSLVQHYIVTITCDLHFLRYPFDNQVSSVNIQLPFTYNNYVQFDPTNSVVAYSGPADLPLYTVKRFSTGTTTTTNRMVFAFELVLYTLFANQTSSLPKTSEVKLVDLWFFFIIFLLFGNVMMHIFVRKNRLGQLRDVEVTQISPALGEETSKGFSLTTIFQWIPYKFLLVYRNVIVPSLIVMFIVIFWVTLYALKVYDG